MREKSHGVRLMKVEGQPGDGATMNERECADPGAVTPEDVLAYLDGDAPLHVVEHLTRCAHCAAAAQAYRDAEQGLQRIFFRAVCPLPQTLGEYELDLVSPDERQQVAAHLRVCDRCTGELRTLREFMAGGLLPVRSDGPFDVVRRIVASLVPPVATPAFAGLRGASDGAALVYQAGNLLLALEWRPDDRPGRFALVGLAMQEAAPDESEDRDVSDRPVHLISDAGAGLIERTDELGNFQFDNLAPGAYRLEIDLDREVIVVEDFRLSR